MEKRGDIGPHTPDVDREMDKTAAAKEPQLRDGVVAPTPEQRVEAPKTGPMAPPFYLLAGVTAPEVGKIKSSSPLSE